MPGRLHCAVAGRNIARQPAGRCAGYVQGATTAARMHAHRPVAAAAGGEPHALGWRLLGAIGIALSILCVAALTCQVQPFDISKGLSRLV